MKLRAPHIVGIALLAIGIIAVLVVQLTGLGKSATNGFGLTTVNGVVGSEKAAFFADPEVQKVFADNGLRVDVTTAGSWSMAERPGLTDGDFAFPASEVAAQHIAQVHPDAVVGTHEPFFSPMAIATFEPVLRVLAESGVASQGADGRWTIDMAAYLELVSTDVRWNQLPGAAGVYDSPRSVLITSTDIRTSNSAGMYLALASYVLGGDRVVSTVEQADELLPALTHLFVSQGYAGASSAAPFADYLSQGMGAVPMVMIYEGQFLEEQLKPNSRIQPNMVLATPGPTIFSAHTGVTFSEGGEQVMRLLETDADLARLLAAHGFRAQGEHAGVFDAFIAEQGLSDAYAPSSSFVNIAQEPAYETLDYLLTRIGEAYTLSGAPPPTEESTEPPGGTP
ncbi:hypothetical protein F8O01_13545 [Pseudoclavibacter chungangensis]|uniref:Extracellular solute-binding protein n=1 Tax=Pseudoclavibacter chungangensis TaxID=587635 RepID=A0A7J5BPE1_9MICO|nr:hypothetical protein [Pseudoclavibacter chungangensis]KAB1654569.1 hypothetical protein F8O01_13545 [Pseudoclavibacter chungangensis]NYJ68192.1 hypothetical protein [Pseudoclavibacter chungangensis]